MKKILSLIIVSFILISIISAPCYAQKASDILEKMIKAQGGRKVLEGIKDTTSTGTMEMIPMGMSGSITIYLKEPNKMRWDVEMMGMVVTRATDGETAWGTNFQTGNLEELPEQEAAEFKRGALGNDSLLNPKKYGITFTLKGKEKIEGKDYFVLEQTYGDGHKTTLYVDSQTYLAHKTITTAMGQMGGEVEEETIISDYKKVNGIMVAHSITVFQDGEEFIKMTYTEVKFNTGLEDSLFKM